VRNPGEQFGVIALRENLLTAEQLKTLLKEQEDSYIFFGEALVQPGAILEQDVVLYLEELNSLRLQDRDQKHHS